MMSREQIIKTKPYTAASYEEHIPITLPYVGDFYRQVITLIRQYGDPAGKLLDLGCGTGLLEKELRAAFPEISITAVDPSADMLEEAEKKKLACVEYRKGVSADLDAVDEYDVITAIMSHHFMQPEERKAVTGKILRALKDGGIYISFENVVPDDEYLKEQELFRWQRFQVDAGKPEKEAELHRMRCGVYYFPITVEEHIRLLKETGFRHVYVFWRSYMQMGILGIK